MGGIPQQAGAAADEQRVGSDIPDSQLSSNTKVSRELPHHESSSTFWVHTGSSLLTLVDCTLVKELRPFYKLYRLCES